MAGIFETLKLFMKAKEMSDTAKAVEDMEPIQSGPGSPPRRPQSTAPVLVPEMLGGGGAQQSAEAMAERNRRLKQLERDLFY